MGTVIRRNRVKEGVAFELPPGRKIGTNYEVIRLLGRGTEGEVYKILETDTGIHRAAKLYFLHKDPRSRAVVWYARKLNKLRHCPIVLQYHHTQVIQVARRKVLCLVSEFCDGQQLDSWARSHRGGRLRPYTALHVLYQLARGMEMVHGVGEYHADVHSQNVLIRPRGVGFDMKLVDFYNWGRPANYKRQQDILDAIRLFYEVLGGRPWYSKLPDEVRYICAGLRNDLILKRFPTMSALRLHLETFEWTQ
ncbi:MAG: protein kinase [Myxococcota bacterium]